MTRSLRKQDIEEFLYEHFGIFRLTQEQWKLLKSDKVFNEYLTASPIQALCLAYAVTQGYRPPITFKKPSARRRYEDAARLVNAVIAKNPLSMTASPTDYGPQQITISGEGVLRSRVRRTKESLTLTAQPDWERIRAIVNPSLKDPAPTKDALRVRYRNAIKKLGVREAFFQMPIEALRRHRESIKETGLHLEELQTVEGLSLEEPLREMRELLKEIDRALRIRNEGVDD